MILKILKNKLANRLIADLIMLVAIFVLSYMFNVEFFREQMHIGTKAIETFVVFLAFLKVFYFLLSTLESINRVIKNEKFTISKFLFFVFCVFLLIQISFALDYLMLVTLNSKSFEGLSYPSDLWISFIDLMYFSVATFCTVGYGDIHANSILTKVVVMAEIISSFAFIILILANYSNLKDGFNKEKPLIGHLEDLD